MEAKRKLCDLPDTVKFYTDFEEIELRQQKAAVYDERLKEKFVTPWVDADNSFGIPFSPYLSEEEQEKVIQALLS